MNKVIDLVVDRNTVQWFDAILPVILNNRLVVEQIGELFAS